MFNRSPFEWIQPDRRGRVFIFVILVTLLVGGALQVLGSPLRTEAAPGGIISFEFASDLETSNQILASWGERGKVYAGLQLGLDYLFMPAYALSIGLGCLLISQASVTLSTGFARLGLWLSWAQILAAALDALENYALIRLLLGSSNTLWPSTAQWCASIKFAFVVAGLIYIIVGGAVRLVRRPTPRESR